MYKKIICVLACAAALLGMSACGSDRVNAETNGKLNIVTTIFPEYDWVRNILGENAEHAELTMLLDSGVDLHSFQPTAEDILRISTCDVFIYVGGESDSWVKDALKEVANKDMVVVDMLESLGDAVKEEELVEGMQGEEEEDEAEEEEGPEYDEHIWLSLRNAASACRVIEAAMEKADPEHADEYSKNADSYIEKLNELDAGYTEAVAAGSTHTLLFGDRFPFRYMADDYGLTYYAAFVGCSAETEASFETIMFLAQKVDELSLKNVMVIESGDGRIAQTIIDNTEAKEAKILKLNSLQSITAKDVDAGVSYLSLMEENLEVLKEALK
ncbi:MAG: metal ABC transporter substrate-binding protein [Lachnospiraceae bacterium]|nr:metal ABC transporter substrate-binding protein [Lachnospiraceae bacterium]